MPSATRWYAGFWAPLWALMLVMGAWAQGTGELTGLITDPTGAVISGAHIKLTNEATGSVRAMETTTAGVYRFPDLPVAGSYTLIVAAPGFRSVRVTGIVVSVGAVATRDVRLVVGLVNETLTVQADAELVQAGDSQLSTLVDQRIWRQMPLDVRSQNEFINLIPGIGQPARATNRGAAVNGTRGGMGNYLLEGTDNNEGHDAGWQNVGPYDPCGAATGMSPDVIQEYRILTNSFLAEYGRAAGFVTDTVLKSGTNQWHGSLFEYNRVQALAARDYFAVPEENVQLVRNQFGGSIGGPIRRDRTFFYGGFELNRGRESWASKTVGTTQQFLDFVNSGGLQNWAEASPAGICNNQQWWDATLGDGTPGSSGVSAAPCAGAFAQAERLGSIFHELKETQPYPLATTGFTNVGAGLYTSGLTYPVPVYGQIYFINRGVVDETKWSLKVDHRFSNANTLSAAFVLHDGTNLMTNLGGMNVIGPDQIYDGLSKSLAATYNHILSPTVLNTFKLGYLRHRFGVPVRRASQNVPSYLTMDGIGVDFGATSDSPWWVTENQFQFLDSLSLIRGNHAFKMGFEYRYVREGSSYPTSPNSYVRPWGIEDLVTDLAFSDLIEQYAFGEPVYGSAFSIQTVVDTTKSPGTAPQYYRRYRGNEVAAYLQDEWRILPTLTLSLGLRWEYFGPPQNYDASIHSNYFLGSGETPIGGSTNPFFPNSSPFYASVARGRFQTGRDYWQRDMKNFAPRIGFAYDMLGSKKLVVRGGFGINYDRIYNAILDGSRTNPPFYSLVTIGALSNGVPVGALATPGLYTYPFTSRAQFANPTYQPIPSAIRVAEDLATPYYEQVHLGLQWEFLPGYLLQPEYVGSFGRRLIGTRDINTFNGRVAGVGSTARINPTVADITLLDNGYVSNYHAFQMVFRNTPSHGLMLSANYTWSKALDDMSDQYGPPSGYPMDNSNSTLDYGPADFNLRHRLVALLSYELPFATRNRWLGGWSINSIFTAQSGRWFAPIASGGKNCGLAKCSDLNRDGYAVDRLVPSGSPMGTLTGGNPADGYFDPAMWGVSTGAHGNRGVSYYACPPSVNDGLWCNSPIGRNNMSGPGFSNLDLGITKRVRIGERSSVSLLVNFFNALNHPNFGLPVRNANNLNFGKSTSTVNGPRITQLALRVDF